MRRSIANHAFSNLQCLRTGWTIYPNWYSFLSKSEVSCSSKYPSDITPPYNKIRDTIKQAMEIFTLQSMIDEFSVDKREVSIVLATSLKSTIQVNIKLTQQYRKILCKMVDNFSTMIGISTSCIDEVTFDSYGLSVGIQIHFF